MRRRVLVAALLLVAPLAVGWQFRKLVFYVALTLGGRNPLCSVWDVARVPRHRESGEHATRRIARAMALLQRDNLGNTLWRTPLGSYWVPGTGSFLAFDLGEQETDFYGAGAQAVRRGDIVLDCGANVGAFARTALRLGAKLVVAIEPAPENVLCLRRNLEREIAGGRVIVVPKGVYDREGTIAFKQDSGNSAADAFVVSTDASQAGLLQLPVVRIDDLVAELKLPRVDFIKMDIEGSERNALAGAAATLAGWRPRLAISAYHRPDDVTVIPALVTRASAHYRLECGACALNRREWRLSPHVLFFR